MKFHILSDLHTEHCSYGAAPVIGDALVLAGDISDARSIGALQVAKNYRAVGKPVFYVPGNHEFYGSRMSSRLLTLRRECKKAGVELLFNRSVVAGDVRVLGTTLWTDFCLYGEPTRAQALVYARQSVSDFSWIFDGNGRGIMPAATVHWHARAVRWLTAELRTPFNGKTLVVTHHGVHPLSIHQRFAAHPINPAFVSNLEPLLLDCGPDVWVHGHVHNSFDYRVGTTRVIANPRGYAKRGPAYPGGPIVERRENPDFNEKLVVEL